MTPLLGAILAGGRSRRFGSDKALAPFEGRTLLAHVRDRLAPQVDSLIVCGGTAGDVADRPEGGLGPLAGLNAALHHAAGLGFAAVLTAPCDAPLLPSDLAARLGRAGGPTFACDSPVIGVWPSRLAPLLDAYLATSADRSMRGWIARCGAIAVDIGPVANVNRPADLARVARASVDLD